MPGAVDVHVHQVVDTPELDVNVDRERAQELGLTQRDVANNLLISLSSSGQASPNYWLDPEERRQLPRRGTDTAVSRSTQWIRFRARPSSVATPVQASC